MKDCGASSWGHPAASDAESYYDLYYDLYCEGCSGAALVMFEPFPAGCGANDGYWMLGQRDMMCTPGACNSALQLARDDCDDDSSLVEFAEMGLACPDCSSDAVKACIDACGTCIRSRTSEIRLMSGVNYQCE